MSDLLKLNSGTIKYALRFLLKDKTTKKNIVWATNSYAEIGKEYSEDHEITLEQLTIGLNTIDLRPRVEKEKAAQSDRTRKKAEVMTPSWVCNKMNNHCDEEWFGRDDVFNKSVDKAWITIADRIVFPDGKTWKDYVDSRRIEITCGEAPYIVSRYDTTTGELIPIIDRIGMLDRKLRIVNENTTTEKDWLEYVFKSFQSVYGYEYQGDNLLIARINLVNTFIDYLDNRWHREPTPEEIRKICNIITWNFWQMDGLKNRVPFVPNEDEEPIEISMFDIPSPDETSGDQNDDRPECLIYDWKGNNSVPFSTRMRER